MGFWSDERGTNLLDGGAHFYGVYETSDGEWISIASYEPQFYAELPRLLAPLGIDARPGDADGPGDVAGAEGADGRRCSAPAPATSGSSSSPATTCASRRSSR